MWSMGLWHISKVFLKGTSLFDCDQIHAFKNASSTSIEHVRTDVRTYESSQERFEPENPPKKEALLIVQAIAKISTMICC